MIIVNPNSAAEKALQYLAMAHRQRWPLIVGMVLGSSVGAGLAYALPKKYESYSTFIVEGQTIPDPFEGRGSAEALERSVRERIQNLQHIVLSRRFLESVIDKSLLRYQADTPAEREALIARLRNSISVDKRGTNVVTLAYRGGDPQETVEVAHIVLAQYEETINEMFGDKLKGIIYFLGEELSEYKDRLAQAAQDLAKFKMEHIDVLPGTEGGHLKRLADLQTMRTDVELSILGKERELEFLHEQIKRMEPYIREQSTVNQSPELQVQARLVESLASQLQNLLLKRTEKSPEVVSLRDRLAEAEAKLEGLKRDATTEISTELLVRNPVLIEQENARAKLELEIMGLKARKESLEAQITQLSTDVASIPEQERQMADKLTEYEIQRQNYLALLREEHSRKLSKSMADHGQGAKFLLLDNPVENRNPVFPSVPLFVAGGLAGGLVLGAAVGLLREWLNQTVRSAEEVRAMLALPVLATVPSLDHTGEEGARVSDQAVKNYEE